MSGLQLWFLFTIAYFSDCTIRPYVKDNLTTALPLSNYAYDAGGDETYLRRYSSLRS